MQLPGDISTCGATAGVFAQPRPTAVMGRAFLLRCTPPPHSRPAARDVGLGVGAYGDANLSRCSAERAAHACAGRTGGRVHTRRGAAKDIPVVRTLKSYRRREPDEERLWFSL